MLIDTIKFVEDPKRVPQWVRAAKRLQPADSCLCVTGGHTLDFLEALLGRDLPCWFAEVFTLVNKHGEFGR